MERYRLEIHKVDEDRFAYRVIDSYTDNILATCRRNEDCKKIVDLLNKDYLTIDLNQQRQKEN